MDILIPEVPGKKMDKIMSSNIAQMTKIRNPHRSVSFWEHLPLVVIRGGETLKITHGCRFFKFIKYLQMVLK